MTIFIGIDDTDTITSRGTGHLARVIADELALNFQVSGVTRHQLLLDPQIPYTAKNSCAAIHVESSQVNLASLVDRVKHIMLKNFEVGSDPGLAIGINIHEDILEFGRSAKQQVLSKTQALKISTDHGVFLESLGGTNDGIIGALAAVGLAADGNDGRYIHVGSARELIGNVSPMELMSAGIHHVKTLDDIEITQGEISAEKLRPSRRNGVPVLFVKKGNQAWIPLKID